MSLNEEDTESSTTCETQIVGGDPELRSYVAFQDDVFMDAFSRNSLSFPSHQKFLAPEVKRPDSEKRSRFSTLEQSVPAPWLLLLVLFEFRAATRPNYE